MYQILLIMKILNKKLVLAAIFATTYIANINAQEAITNVQQDEKIPMLLELKTKLAKESKLNDRYKIQLFYGELKKANEVLKEYRSMPFGWSSSIEYETPNYKVWIGNFRNRLEADRALIEIKTAFPNAFIFKPDRK